MKIALNIKKFANLLFVITLLALMYACEDSNEPTKVDGLDFPLKVGNYWVFKSDVLEYPNSIMSGTQKLDSIVITDNLTILNKNAYRFVHYSNNKVLDTFYLCKENQYLYELYDINKTGIIDLQTQWFKVMDKTVDVWAIYSSRAANYPYNYKDKQIVFDTSWYNVAAYKDKDTSIIVDYTPYNSKKYRLKIDSKTYFGIIDYDTTFNDNSTEIQKIDTINVNLLNTIVKQKNYYFDAQKGFIMIEQMPYNIEILPTKYVYLDKYYSVKYVTGWRCQLLRSYIQ